MITLGPRALKTGISVTLALYICYFFGLEPAVFAAIAAVFSMQPSIYRTWRQMLDQLMTNTFGAIIALLAVKFLDQTPLTIGVVLIFVILISLKLKMEGNIISLTIVTVLAIMTAPGNEDWLYALNRFTIMMIGIFTAFLINALLFPPKFKQIYYQKVQEAFQTLSLLLRTAISDELTEKTFKENWAMLIKSREKLEEQYKIFDEEREKMAKINPLNVREIVVFKQMLKTIKQGEAVLEVIDEHYFQSKTNDEENQLFDQFLEHLIKCHEYYLLKYEGKVKIEDSDTISINEEELKLFFEKLLNNYKEDPDNKMRIISVGVSVFEYAFQLQRFNKLLDSYLKKTIL
ncbi:FUSC family protein [Metabacillus sediminilitoris]|uniref:FUSC family protein n=1 Tax=Metabacillus sediminilitoris TaxID=2567941 RepID=UPI001D0DBB2E|nr:aromatic acid exporter family protein [Metabacillus sediminilitoris]